MHSQKMRTYLLQQKKLDEAHFEVFRPFFSAPGSSKNESLKLHSLVSLLYIMKLLVRRIIFLYVVMFFKHYAFLQMFFFVWMALLNLFYLGFLRPHEEPSRNYMEIVNEFFVLICAYLR